MSYRYNPYTDTFTHIDDEPNIAIGTPQIAFTVQKVELAESCIEKIAEAVVRKLKEVDDEHTD